MWKAYDKASVLVSNLSLTQFIFFTMRDIIREIPFESTMQMYHYMKQMTVLHSRHNRKLCKDYSALDDFTDLDDIETYFQHACIIYGGTIMSITTGKRNYFSKNIKTMFLEIECTMNKKRLRSKFAGNKYHPAYALVIDHKNKAIVLAIRGSINISDIIIDSVFETQEFSYINENGIKKTGLAHKGLVLECQKFEGPNSETIRDSN